MTTSINYMKLVMSVGMIVFAAALVIGGTGAFFSDTETSTGNVFAAGALDLKVDSVAHYNGLVCFDGVWHPEEIVFWNDAAEPPQLQLVDQANVQQATADYISENPAMNPTAGEACMGTWELTDLGPTYQFFTFPDLKPGDEGENTLSLHVYNNDAYACVVIDNMFDDDLSLTEPEVEAGDTTVGANQGELAQELKFFAWTDDGDNIWEPNNGEIELFSNTAGPASDVLDGVAYPLFTPQTEAILAEDTRYIGLYWCYGEISTAGDVLSCDGSAVTNVSQTDQLTADITFYVEQARNNEGFSCEGLVVNDAPRVVVGAALGAYTAPVGDACDYNVSGHDALETALGQATANQTLCLDDMNGVYSGPIVLTTEGLTLAGVGSPLISGGVIINAPDVTVTGFELRPGNLEGTAASFYLKEAADNATISYNFINSSSDGSTSGIVNVSGTDLPGVVINNNVIQGPNDGTGTGIYTNPHTGLWTISNNDFSNWLAGIGGLMGANVINNEFIGGGEAIGLDSAFDSNPSVVSFNNFLDDVRLNTYGTITTPIDATNNYWGPNGGAAQTNNNGGTNTINLAPEAGAPFLSN